MKKIIALFLMMVMLVNMVIQASAASSGYTGTVGGIKNGITVTKDNAPLRAKPDGKSTVLCRAEKGAVLKVVSTVRTGFLGYKKWYKVTENGNEYYLFADNAVAHKHTYTPYAVYGTNFKICDCGHVVYTTYQKSKIQKAESFAALGPVAIGAVASDGPFPVGDAVAAAIVAVGTIYMLTGEMASNDTIREVAVDIDFVDYLKNSKNECTDESYRMVRRTAGSNLKFISDACLSLGQAYVYVRYCGGDVWCKNDAVAKPLAELDYFGCYYEHDKDEVTYYWHYHLGENAAKKVGGHIFYGKNDLGQMPA